MKYFKLLTVALLGVFAGTSLASAQAADTTNDPNNIGRAKAYLTRGTVQKSLAASPDTWTTVARGTDFLPGDSIKTGADGNCMLVFSNGAAIQIKPSSTLTITQYEQATFNQGTQGTFMRLKADPSKSTTRLDLKQGSLAGEVKQLNIKQGSTFDINTPAGSAGIRGTMVSISISINGQTFTVNAQCVEGVMVFTPRPTTQNPNPAPITIPAGSQGNVSIDIVVATTPGGAPTLSNLSVNGQEVSTEESNGTIGALTAFINDAIEQYNTDNPGNPIDPMVPPPAPPPSNTQDGDTTGTTPTGGTTPTTDQPNTNPTLVSQ